MQIKIVKLGITNMDVDVIVNAANSELRKGSGVCGAIFAEAGYEKLQEACRKIGHCDTGDAVITPGFALKAKYIIHAVGPIWRDGNYNEKELLYSCYKNSLKLAKENNCNSICFPLISSGIFGYPKDEAWKVAINACNDFLKETNNNIEIYFAVLDDVVKELGEKILNS